MTKKCVVVSQNLSTAGLNLWSCRNFFFAVTFFFNFFLHIVSAFVDKGGGGKPAGVVFLEETGALKENQMQEVARQVALSETVLGLLPL